MKEQYEIHWVDYYALLQVQPSAEAEVIEGAYKQLMLKYHPDKTGDGESSDKVKLLNEAKAVLRDPDRRERYDRAYAAKIEAARAEPPKKRVQQARKRLRETEEETWLARIRKPHLLVQPSDIDFGVCERGEVKTRDVIIRVSEGRVVIGDISPDRPWIGVSPTELFS